MDTESVCDGWSWVTGAGTNKAGETFECASFRHSTSALVVELRLDSAHGALFRSAGGGVVRVDRHDGSLMQRPAFLAPELETTLCETQGAPLRAGCLPPKGEWRQGFNDSNGVLTMSFVYKDNSKLQAYLTAKGEFLWYPLKDNSKVLYASGNGHSTKTRQEANPYLR